MSEGINSSAPTTAEIVGGVYNATPPTLQDGQGAALQLTSAGALKVDSSGSGGTEDVNIVGIDGNPPALSNPLPVELSDGTQALGTNSNPIRTSPASGAATQPVSGTVAVSNFPATQPVSAASLPLPSNAAQETGGNLATLAGAVSSGKVQENLAQVGGTTVDTNSGSKSAGTQRVVIATDQPTLQVSSSPETSTVFNGTTALTPLFANLTASSSGVTTLIALVSAKKIRVLALSLVANAAVNVKFQSHVTPTDISGLYYCAANGGFVLPFNPAGWFQTISGEALDINLSGAVAVGGSIVYVTV